MIGYWLTWGAFILRQAEGQKVEQKQVAAEKQVLSKLEKIRLDQEQRCAALAKDARAEELQVRVRVRQDGSRCLLLGAARTSTAEPTQIVSPCPPETKQRVGMASWTSSHGSPGQIKAQDRGSLNGTGSLTYHRQR